MDTDQIVYRVPSLEECKELSSKNLFTVISTFSGGGGSSTGYRMAGGKVLAINEFIESAQETYSANWPETVVFGDDIRKISGLDLLKAVGLKVGELDVFDGSPPCSSFSSAGIREEGYGRVKKYSDKEQRTDDLFFEYARLLKDIQPKVFIAENVKGITEGEAKNLLGSEQFDMFGECDNTIYHTLVNAGYNVRFEVLNALDYGVPQSRNRTIFIGVRKDIKKKITYPLPFPRKPFTLSEAFLTLEQTAEEIAEANIDRFAVGKEIRNLELGGQSEKYFSLVRCHPEQPSPCLTATTGSLGAAGICHWDFRKFTVAEAKRIQSFPDDYILKGTYQQRVERLGRSVPPLMMKAIAEHVYKTILQ